MIPTEAEEGRTLVAYLRVKRYRFTHIANETGRNGRFQGIRNKQQGVSPGFPDYLVIVGNELVAIELKRKKKARVSQHQLEWLFDLNAAGVPASVCYGAEAAINFIKEREAKI